MEAHEGPLREAQNGPACPPAPDPEQALVLALAQAVVACRAAGRDHAARVAWRALGELLAQPSATCTGVVRLTPRGDPHDADQTGGE